MKRKAIKRAEKTNEQNVRNVYVLGTVSFLNDVSSEMIAPLLPLFIESLGGSAGAIGIIGGLRESISSMLKVFSGYLSDKWGKRKPLVFAGYLISALFKFLLALSRSWTHIALFSSAERVGKGIRTAPRDAIIAESMPKERGRGFGIHRAMDSGGAVIGSIIALLLLWKIEFSIRMVILAAGILSFFSLLPLHFVKERKTASTDKKFHVSIGMLPPHLRKYIMVMTLFALANFSYMFFILRASNVMEEYNKVIVPVALYILFNIFYTIFSIPFGKLSDRVGRAVVVVSGYFLFSIVCLGFMVSNSMISLILLFALYGVFYAATDGNQRALIADLSPRELRATALGAFHTAIGIASLPASFIAGFLWELVGAEATFMYGAILSFFAAILLFIVDRAKSFEW